MTFKIGFIAPLSEPGWREAGEQLLSGFQLGIKRVNACSDFSDRQIEVVIRDTAGSPERAEDAVREMKNLGVAALAGEYHSVVARAAARTANELHLPYICSSAVIDQLVDQPSSWIARLSPPQSIGWSLFADFLSNHGHSNIAAVTTESTYWVKGIEILRNRLRMRGGQLTELSFLESNPAQIIYSLETLGASSLLLLLGFPEPVTSIVRAVRANRNFDHVLLGAPAGQPEFAQWHRNLGQLGTGIPFLRYLPINPSSAVQDAFQDLRRMHNREPSFVALEGLDSALIVADLLRTYDNGNVEPWTSVITEGSRGRISFTFDQRCGVWQWATAPVQVASLNRLVSPEAKVLLAPSVVA
ncbi:MAG: ABC transporter substrate-binding protein [Rhodanobacter sp.]|nr:ABC transporter substrate-binding protein [Rhodanobacter sp.]